MARPGGYFRTPPKPKRKKGFTVASERTKSTQATRTPKPKAPALVPFSMIDTVKKPKTGPIDIRTAKPKYRHTYIHKPTGLPIRIEREGTKKQHVRIMAPHVDTPAGPIYYRRAEAQGGRSDVASKNFKLKMFRGPDIPVIGQGHLSKEGTLSLRGAKVKIGKLPRIDYTQAAGRDLFDALGGIIKANNMVGGGYDRAPGLRRPSIGKVVGDVIKLNNKLGRDTAVAPGIQNRALHDAIKAIGNVKLATAGNAPGQPQAGGYNIKLKDVANLATKGIATGGKGAFHALTIPQHELFKSLGVKSGADLAQKIGVDKRFGLAADIGLDPVMWASVVAAPETGGASLTALAARVEAAGEKGKALLRSAEIVNAASRTRATRDASHLHTAIEQALAQDPELSAAVKRVSNKQVRRMQKAMRGKHTREIINSLRIGAEDAPVIPKRAGLERLTSKAVKGKGRAKVYVPGLEGPESVLSAARSVEHAGLTRPGLRFQMISPTGSKRLFGKDLPGVNVPLAGWFRAPALKRTRLAVFNSEKQQAIGKAITKYDQPLRDLDKMIAEVRKNPNLTRQDIEKSVQQLEKQKEIFTKQMDAEVHRITRELNQRGPRFMVDLKTRSEINNAHKLARTINPVADEFGRMVSNRYMRLVHDAVSILPKGAAAKQRSLERVDLLMRAMHETAGGEKVLERAGYHFTDAERQVAQSLRTIYDDYLRHGQELGVFGPGLQGGHYVPRVWVNTNRQQSLKTEDVVNQIVDNLTGGVGSHSSFLHQRVHPETFTLHGRESLKDSIARLADNPNIDEEALNTAADTLHERGQMKLAGNLLIRGLQRGQVFRLGEDPIIDRAYEYLQRLAPRRGHASVPLVTETDGVIRFADNDIEHHYGIRPDLFDTRTGAALSHEGKKGVHFQLAAEDLANVRKILDDAESVHLNPEYHAFLEDQNARLSREANSHLQGENWGLRTEDIKQPTNNNLTPEQIREVHDQLQTIDPKYRHAPVTVISEDAAIRMGQSPLAHGWYDPSQNRVFVVYRTEQQYERFWNRLHKDQDEQGFEEHFGQGPSEDFSPIEPPRGASTETNAFTLSNASDHWDALSAIENQAPSEIAGIARKLFDDEPVTGQDIYQLAIWLDQNIRDVPKATELAQALADTLRGGESHGMINMSKIPERRTRPKRGAEGDYPVVPDFWSHEIRSILAEKKLQQRGYGKGKLSQQAARSNINPRTGKPLPPVEDVEPGTVRGLTYPQWRDAHSYRSVMIHEFTHSVNLRSPVRNQWLGTVEKPEGTIRGAVLASRSYIGKKSLSGLSFDPVTGSGMATIENSKKIEAQARKLWTRNLPGGAQLNDALVRAARKAQSYKGSNTYFSDLGTTIGTLLGGSTQIPSYADQLAMMGEHAGAMVEIIPRFAQMMAHNEGEFVKLVGEKDAKMLKEMVLSVQDGVSLERRGPIKLNEDGIAWLMDPKGQPPNGKPPHFTGPDAFDDPFDYSQFLPDLRDENMEIVLDPRRANYYRTRSQGVVSATVARVKAIDTDLGRSVTEAKAMVELPDGKRIPASQLRLSGQTSDEGTKFYTDIDSLAVYAEGDLHFPERALIPNSDGSIFYDPQTHKEYVHPSIPSQEGQSARVMTLGADRLWPTETVDAFRQELGQAGRYDRLFYTGMDGLGGKILANIRYGVTTPFPAYHIRNMVSDMLKSLQADSGVLFHPIANAKLTAAAFGKKSGYIRVPGYGKLPMEDFLFMADTFGLNSGHHVAEIYRLMEQGQWNETAARRLLHEVSLIGPNSRFGQAAIHFGNSRENVMRFITFMQRLRRNDGDAADAALYMIRHHFNYNDISQTEKRVFRNVFLFYTWYRKNIPLQLIEIARRPGFFAGLAHGYSDFAQGETPLNQDYSKIAPWMPDLSGSLPKQNLIPDYFAKQLGAFEGNWNGHSLAVGFGAPWSDLAMLRLNQDGFNQVLSMMNPAITTTYSLGTKRDTLTGRDLMAYEPSGSANLVDQIERLAGAKLRRDKNGNPVLPFWVDRVLRNVPVTGRAFGSIGAPTDAKRDPGRAQSLSRGLSPLLGLNVFIGPGGGARTRLQQQKAAAALAAQLNDYKLRISNLPKDMRDKMGDAKRKELEKQWVDKGLKLRVLYNAHGWPNPDYAQKKRGRKRKIGATTGRPYFPGSGTGTKFPGSGGF